MRSIILIFAAFCVALFISLSGNFTENQEENFCFFQTDSRAAQSSLCTDVFEDSNIELEDESEEDEDELRKKALAFQALYREAHRYFPIVHARKLRLDSSYTARGHSVLSQLSKIQLTL